MIDGLLLGTYGCHDFVLGWICTDPQRSELGEMVDALDIRVCFCIEERGVVGALFTYYLIPIHIRLDELRLSRLAQMPCSESSGFVFAWLPCCLAGLRDCQLEDQGSLIAECADETGRGSFTHDARHILHWSMHLRLLWIPSFFALR